MKCSRSVLRWTRGTIDWKLEEGRPCQKVAATLAETCPSVSWTVERDQAGYGAGEVSRQMVASTAWLLLAIYSKNARERRQTGREIRT